MTQAAGVDFKTSHAAARPTLTRGSNRPFYPNDRALSLPQHPFMYSCYTSRFGQRLVVAPRQQWASIAASTVPRRSWPRSIRHASSAAAVQTAPPEEAGSLHPDESSHSSTKRRPRLEALRTRIRSEIASSDGGRPLLITRTRKAKSTSAIPLNTENNLEALLEQLPDPPLDSAILTDRFARPHSYLRLSLTERCNLRCTYCMPEAGVPLQPPDHLLQTSELLTLASFFKTLGVTKFRLTGGEPTLRKDLVDVIAGLAALEPTSIGMTSNGISLKKLLPDLAFAGLSSVNLSLDTLHPDKFSKLTRRPPAYLDRVLESLEALSNQDTITMKLNCVVMRGVNDDEIADFIRLSDRYQGLQVRFIEYMPFTENGWNWDQCIPYQELLDRVKQHNDSDIHLTAVPSDDPHDTTKWYTTTSNHHHHDSVVSPNVGFITSMSQHFCASCNRLRLTADGRIKVCLFDGTTEVSLRDVLRKGHGKGALKKLVYAALQQKHFKLGGHEDPEAIRDDADNNRPMTLIGG